MEIEQEEMMYLDGGVYLSKYKCGQICAYLAVTPGTFIALAGSAAIARKLVKFIKAGGIWGWILGIASGVIIKAAARIAYCIGYGALKRGCDINGSPYPWDAFISATVR